MFMNKKAFAVLLCLCLAFSFMFVHLSADAADLKPHEQDSSLTVEYIYSGKYLPGIKFDIFKVAEFTDDAHFELCGPFAGYAVDINSSDDESRMAAANVLYGNAVRDGVSPGYSGVTDDSGKCRFQNLASGLYLIATLQSEYDGYLYSAAPYLIGLPNRVREKYDWNYDITTNPKPERIKVPDSSDSDAYTDIHVLKVWDNGNNPEKQPEELKVSIYCDGKLYNSVTLNESNRWSHTWERLSRGSNWVIAEEDIQGYMSAGVWFGNTYRLTNTYRGSGHKPQTDTDKTVTTDSEGKITSDTDYRPANSDGEISTDSSYNPKNNDITSDSQNERLPQTGVLWWPVPMMIALGLLFVIVGLLIKRRGIKNEKQR